MPCGSIDGREGRSNALLTVSGKADTATSLFQKTLVEGVHQAQGAEPEGGFLMRSADQLLDGLEPLILAALDELCTLDDEGVAQTIVLAELQHVLDTLQRHCDLDLDRRQRVDDAFEMYQRIREVSELRRSVKAELAAARPSRIQAH